jgi:hypothetical protein
MGFAFLVECPTSGSRSRAKLMASEGFPEELRRIMSENAETLTFRSSEFAS